MTERKTSGLGRGWNFRKGAKDAPNAEELRERARKGGQARVPKGFSAKSVMEKALETRKNQNT